MSKSSSLSFFDYVKNVKKFIDIVVSSICISIVAIMTFLVTYQVFSRYIFNSPSGVSEVLSRYLFIWLVLFGGAYVFGLREHMSIEYIKQKFPIRVQILFDMFSEFIIMVFTLTIMILGGFNASVRQMWQLDSALQIPMGVIYSSIPISGGIILFYFLYNEMNLYYKLKQHN